jgi:non-homologous end joining protein Ku
MKKLISLVSAIMLFSNLSFADCKFSDLVHNADGTVVYSKADHVCVGQAVQDNAVKAKQIDDLNKAVQLKDLTITTANKRSDDWMATSMKLEENNQKMSTLQRDEFWIAFGLGVLTTFAAGMAAAQLTNRH